MAKSKQSKTRFESDSLGKVAITKGKLWGAQTERACKHFAVGAEIMPQEIICALAMIKKTAALANAKLKKMPKYKANLITRASNEIISGKLANNFCLNIWQSGSGTQTNMNVNEVIANRAIQLAGGIIGSKNPIHPNDDVNMAQSTNDVFPTAMHVATLILAQKKLLPVLYSLRQELRCKEQQFSRINKVGRTHLQDAASLTLGQEFSGYCTQIDDAITNIKVALRKLFAVPLGGTAVGNGVNAPKNFGKIAVRYLAQLTKINFREAKNKFALLAAHDALVNLSGTLKTLSVALIKIANDLRWMNSGPNCGLGELILPGNEPGSSIMPGKVNPTQCEMLTMISAQVIGNDATITFAGSQGNFELNVFKPVIIYNLLQSMHLLSDGCRSFIRYALRGLRANRARIKRHLDSSLMMITLLTPTLGYDKSAEIVKLAIRENISWQQACIKRGIDPQLVSSLVNVS